MVTVMASCAPVEAAGVNLAFSFKPLTWNALGCGEAGQPVGAEHRLPREKLLYVGHH